jgi:hypothetical protein
MPVDGLAAKLARYGRLFRYTLPDGDEPLWTSRYPAFPTVLVVLANGSRRALEGRRAMVLALMTEGPFAHIVRSTRAPHDQTDWLSRCWSASPSHSRAPVDKGSPRRAARAPALRRDVEDLTRRSVAASTSSNC